MRIVRGLKRLYFFTKTLFMGKLSTTKTRCSESKAQWPEKDLKLVFMLMLVACLPACTNYEYHETKQVSIERVGEDQERLIEEQHILDVGVVLFDPGVVDLNSSDAGYSSVRQSEAVWYTNQLKQTLDISNAWGLVRALPRDNLGLDVYVSGTLLESNGEVVRLLVSARDSTGRLWFSKEYGQRASAYAYNPEVNLPGDPFQATFNEIANDMFDFQASLADAQLLNIRSVSKVLFARDFVPDAFSSFVQTDELGQLSLTRIPADNDPMMQRVERIRSRNDLFLDVVQDYYRTFNNKMDGPYQEWRKLSYKEVLYERQLKEQGRKEKIAGLVAMAGGLAAAATGNSGTTRGAGHIGIIAGAGIFVNSFLKTEEALEHSSALRELGASLESELEPSIVDLQDRSVTLSGTVDDQYQEWRRILGDMFRLEEGDISQQGPLTVSNSELDKVQSLNKVKLTAVPIQGSPLNQAPEIDFSN
ncbi:MAG: hypothetical protein JKX81_08005 [Arenicella sp.]|nr:hypothetical protein [Arenicella sp.]